MIVDHDQIVKKFKKKTSWKIQKCGLTRDVWKYKLNNSSEINTISKSPFLFWKRPQNKDTLQQTSEGDSQYFSQTRIRETLMAVSLNVWNEIYSQVLAFEFIIAKNCSRVLNRNTLNTTVNKQVRSFVKAQQLSNVCSCYFGWKTM